DEFAKRAASRFDIAGDPIELLGRGVELGQHFVGLFVELIVIEHLPNRALARTHVGDYALNISSRPAKVVVEFGIVEQPGDRAIAFGNLGSDVLELENGAVQVHIKSIIVKQLPDRAFALIDIVHQLLKLLADGVELNEDIARARKDLRQAGLIGAGDLAAVKDRLGGPSARSYINHAIAKESLLGENGLRVPSYSPFYFLRVHNHRNDNRLFIFACWHCAELNGIDLADELAGQPHLVALLQSIGGGKANCISGVMLEERYPSADA